MAKTSAPKSAKGTRSTKKAAAAELVLNHTESIELDSSLDDLIASLEAPEVASTPAVSAAADEIVEDNMLAAAIEGAEATEAMIAAATPDGIVSAAATPTGDASDVTTVESAAAPKEKKERTPRKHYTDKTERLKDKLGSGLTEYSVLTLADAGVDEADLVNVMEATMGIIKAMNKKEQNWAVKFIEYLAGKKSSMSEVTKRILDVLHTEGTLTTGNEGNVFKNLVARPYSPGAARAMGGNNIGMLVDLKVIVADGKGKYVANPDSLLLAKANSMLFAPAA